MTTKPYRFKNCPWLVVRGNHWLSQHKTFNAAILRAHYVRNHLAKFGFTEHPAVQVEHASNFHG